MKTETKLMQIRQFMEKDGVDAWIVYGTDPHGSEFVCPRWKTRTFISGGFDHSAGTIVITQKEAILWIGPRYFIQASKQLDSKCYKLMETGVSGVNDYVAYLKKDSDIKNIGASGDTLMKATYDALKAEGFKVIPTNDYLNDIWQDREPIPTKPVTRMNDQICGLSAQEKIQQIRTINKQRGVTNFFLSKLDDIAWTLNLRGSDIDYNPVFLSYMLITEKEVVLFTDKVRFSAEDYKYLTSFITIKPYDEVGLYLSKLPKGFKVSLDEKKTNIIIYKSFPVGTEFNNCMDITSELKTCKNSVEIEGMKKAHIADGIAFANFRPKLAKLTNLKESDVFDLFNSEREKQKFAKYIEPSFGSISGFGSDGALPDYMPKPETSAPIDGSGMLVLDTGGQYDCGTTDLTRTILFGKATDIQKRDYTLVLKGHLALKRAKFPEGTNGMQLDTFAKQFMWKYGITFTHGTGHGVGFHLCVHEDPARISSGNNGLYPIKEGMVISDEPGLYKERRHGIRIENLIYVKKAEKTEFGQFFEFVNLSVVPYEKELIDLDLLTDEEVKQINDYHKWVYNKLENLVSDEGREYLKAATKPLMLS